MLYTYLRVRPKKQQHSQGSCTDLLLWGPQKWTSRVQPKCLVLAQAPSLAHHTEATRPCVEDLRQRTSEKGA